MTTLVRQEDDYGCGIAALAMIAGTTYEDVRAWLLANWPGGDAEHTPEERLTNLGIHKGTVDWYLARHGYVWRTVYGGWKIDPWPPEPFAPVHLVQVRQPSNNSHYVVMRADGVVLDPLSDEPRRLSDWPEAWNVQGIWSGFAPEPSTSPDQDAQRRKASTAVACKHGNTEPHYLRFTTGTTAHCPGPVSLEQQETQQ